MYLLQVLLPEMWGAFGRVPRGVACVTTSTTVCVLNTFQCVVDYCSILDVTRRVTRAYCLMTEEVIYHLKHILSFAFYCYVITFIDLENTEIHSNKTTLADT